MLATVHYVSLIVYACVIANALIDLNMLRRCKSAAKILKKALLCLLILVLLQSCALIYLQTNWLFGDPTMQIGETASLTWLAFDLLNGLVMLTYVVSIHIFLGWKTKEDFDIVEIINGINTEISKTN